MAISFAPKLPTTAKTSTYDVASKILKIHASHPLPIPNDDKEDHLIQVKTTALCARELTWPTLFSDAIYSENPTKEIIPGYDLAGIVMITPPNSPFHIGDEIYARTLPIRPGDCRDYTIARTNEMALKPENLTSEEASSMPE